MTLKSDTPYAARSSFWRRATASPWFAAGIIVVAVGVAYIGSFRVPLVLDDAVSITENSSIRSLVALNKIFSPPAEAATSGRPVANLSFALSYALSGNEPWGHHLLNLILHLLVALTLFGVVARTLNLPSLRENFGEEASLLAGMTALVWSVHPLQTQTVTYLSQRTESLMALFYLLTLYCFIRGLEGQTKLWHGLAVVSGLLGAMSKEVIVTVPLVVLLYDRVFVAGAFREALRQRWTLYAGLAVTWVLIAWLLVGVGQRGVGFDLGVTPFHYALTQCKAVPTYLSLCFWPHPLIFDRGPLLLKSLSDAWPYALLLGTLLAGSVWALRRWPQCGFASVCFFVLLAPTSSIVPVIGAPIAENRPYLPLAAIVVLAIVGLRAATDRRVTCATVGLLAALCIGGTIRRNHDYRDAIGLWTDTLRKAPKNFRAHNNLAVLLTAEPGRRTEASEHLETALRLNPDYAGAHNNLGGLLAADPARHAEARAHYETALRLKPDYAEAHYNFALLLSQEPARQAEALGHYEAALRFKPDYAEAENNLANLLVNLPGRQTEAFAHYERALRLTPDYAEAHLNLGALLAKTAGRDADAQAHYETALRLKPDYAEAHTNLANLLMRAPGRATEALAHYEATVRLKPVQPDAHNNLATLLAEIPGRRADALAHYETALRLKPDWAEAHYNLANLLAREPGQQAKALAHYQAALNLQPDFVEAHNNLAALLTDEPGREAEALTHYQAVLRLRPGSAIVHYNIARLLEKSAERRNEARSHYETALALDPQLTQAKEALHRMQQTGR